MSTDANFDVSLDYNTLVTEIDALVDINSKCYELLGAICNAADAAGMLDSGYLIINAFNTVDEVINGPIRDTIMNIMSVESLFNIFQNQDFYTDYFSNVDKDGDGNLDIDYEKLLTVMVSLVNTSEECFQLADNYEEVLDRYSVMLREIEEQIDFYEKQEFSDANVKNNSYLRDYASVKLVNQKGNSEKLLQLREKYNELVNIMAVVKSIRDYTYDKGFFLFGGNENFESLSGDANIRIASYKMVQTEDYLGSLAGDERYMYEFEFYDSEGNLLTGVSDIEASIYFAKNGLYTTDANRSGNMWEPAQYSRSYSYLNDQELKIANYLYNSGNFDKLEEFLEFKENYANAREGAMLAQEFISKIDGYYANALTDSQKNLAYAKTLSLLAGTGFVDGWCSFAEGFENLVTADGKISVEQYKTMEIISALNSNDENAIGKLFDSNWQSVGATGSYEIFNSIGNMAPSMIIGAVTHCPQLGSALMGVSAAGNAREQGLQAGMSNLEAWQYGILSGASEAATEFLLGGIPYLSSADDLTDLLKNPIINKMIDANPNMLKFFNSGLYRYGENMVSEGIEEMFQTGILEPTITALVTGEIQTASLEEVLKSGVYGSISSGITQGVTNTGSSILNLAVNHTLANGPTIILNDNSYSMRNMSKEFINDFVGKYGKQDLSDPNILAQVEVDLAPYIVGGDSSYQKGRDTTIPVVPPKSRVPSAQQAQAIVKTARTVIEEQGGTIPNETPVVNEQGVGTEEKSNLGSTSMIEPIYEDKVEVVHESIASHDDVRETSIEVEERTTNEVAVDVPVVSEVMAENLSTPVGNELTSESSFAGNTEGSSDIASGIAVSGLATAALVSQETMNTKVNGEVVIDAPDMDEKIELDDGSNTVTSKFDLEDESHNDGVLESTINIENGVVDVSTEKQDVAASSSDEFYSNETDVSDVLRPGESLASRIGIQFFATPKTNSGTVVDGISTDISVQAQDANGTVSDAITIDSESGEVSVDTNTPRNIIIEGKNFIVKMCSGVKNFISAKHFDFKIKKLLNKQNGDITLIINSTSDDILRFVSPKLISSAIRRGLYSFSNETPLYLKCKPEFILASVGWETGRNYFELSNLDYSGFSSEQFEDLIYYLNRFDIPRSVDLCHQPLFDYVIKNCEKYPNLTKIAIYYCSSSLLSEYMESNIKILTDNLDLVSTYPNTQKIVSLILSNPEHYELDIVISALERFDAIVDDSNLGGLFEFLIKNNYCVNDKTPAILKRNFEFITSSIKNSKGNINIEYFNFDSLSDVELDEIIILLEQFGIKLTDKTSSRLIERIVIKSDLSSKFIVNAMNLCSPEILTKVLYEKMLIFDSVKFLGLIYGKNADIVIEYLLNNINLHSKELVFNALNICSPEVFNSNLESILLFFKDNPEFFSYSFCSLTPNIEVLIDNIFGNISEYSSLIPKVVSCCPVELLLEHMDEVLTILESDSDYILNEKNFNDRLLIKHISENSSSYPKLIARNPKCFSSDIIVELVNTCSSDILEPYISSIVSILLENDKFQFDLTCRNISLISDAIIMFEDGININAKYISLSLKYCSEDILTQHIDKVLRRLNFYFNYGYSFNKIESPYINLIADHVIRNNSDYSNLVPVVFEYCSRDILKNNLFDVLEIINKKTYDFDLTEFDSDLLTEIADIVVTSSEDYSNLVPFFITYCSLDILEANLPRVLSDFRIALNIFSHTVISDTPGGRLIADYIISNISEYGYFVTKVIDYCSPKLLEKNWSSILSAIEKNGYKFNPNGQNAELIARMIFRNLENSPTLAFEIIKNCSIEMFNANIENVIEYFKDKKNFKFDSKCPNAGLIADFIISNHSKYSKLAPFVINYCSPEILNNNFEILPIVLTSREEIGFGLFKSFKYNYEFSFDSPNSRVIADFIVANAKEYSTFVSTAVAYCSLEVLKSNISSILELTNNLYFNCYNDISEQKADFIIKLFSDGSISTEYSPFDIIVAIEHCSESLLIKNMDSILTLLNKQLVTLQYELSGKNVGIIANSIIANASKYPNLVPKIIDYCSPELLRENISVILEMLNNGGYQFNPNNPNSKVIADFIISNASKYGYDGLVPQVIDYCSTKILEQNIENVLLILNNNGNYEFNPNNPNSKVIVDFIMNNASKYSGLVLKVIDYCSPELLMKNMIDILDILSNSYRYSFNPNSPNAGIIFESIMKNASKYSNLVLKVIDYCPSELLIENISEVLKVLNSYSYIFNINSPNAGIIVDVVIKNASKYSNLVLKVVDHCSSELLNENMSEVLEVLNSYGYRFNPNSPNASIIVDTVIKNASKYPHLVLKVVDHCSSELLNENISEVLEVLNSYGYRFNPNSPNASIIVDTVIKNASKYPHLVLGVVDHCSSELLNENISEVLDGLNSCGYRFNHNSPNASIIVDAVIKNASKYPQLFINLINDCSLEVLMDNFDRVLEILNDKKICEVPMRIIDIFFDRYCDLNTSKFSVRKFISYVGAFLEFSYVIQKPQICYEIFTRLEHTNSKSFEALKSSLIPQILLSVDPISTFNKIESIFEKNNIPFFGKQFLAFQALYPEFSDYSYSFEDESRIAPQLKDNTLIDIILPGNLARNLSLTEKRFIIIYNDLLRIAIRSNNPFFREYLMNIDRGNSLFLDISSGKIKFESLLLEQKKDLEIFVEHLETLFLNTKKGKNSNVDFSECSLVEKLEILSDKFRPNGKYDLRDKIITHFAYSAGYTRFDDIIRDMDASIKEADARGRQYAKELGTSGRFMFEVGDFVRCFGDLMALSGSLDIGNFSKEFMTLIRPMNRHDTTPLDIDITMIDGMRHDKGTGEKSESLYQSIAGTATGFGFGNMYFIIKKDNPNFNITRDQDGNLTGAKYDPSKVELFGTHVGFSGEPMHWGARTGVSMTDVDYILYKSKSAIDFQKPYDENGDVNYVDVLEFDSEFEALKFEIARHGFYIPVIDFSGKLIFTVEEYEVLRSKLNGLSHYGITDYKFSSKLDIPNVDEIVSKFNSNNEEMSIKRQKIERLLQTVFDRKEFGIQRFSREVVGDLTPGCVELIDTGSTGRCTNSIGGGDFDFLLRVDRVLVEDYEKFKQFKEAIKDLLCGFPYDIKNSDILFEKGDFRLKGVQIDSETVVDIDISIVIRTDKINYSSDECLKDRLRTMERINPLAYRYSIANIVEAKRVLKDAGVYKSSHSKYPQGGLGGIGIENWILQHGGSFVDAAESFVSAALGDDWRKSGRTQAKYFKLFKLKYSVWDFGQNHFSERKGNYLHDNFVDCNMSEVGYERMVEVLRNYLLDYYDSGYVGKDVFSGFNGNDDSNLLNPGGSLTSRINLQFFATPNANGVTVVDELDSDVSVQVPDDTNDVKIEVDDERDLDTDSDSGTDNDSDTDSNLGKKIVGFGKKVGKVVLTTYLTNLGMMAISGLLDGIETIEPVDEDSDDVLDSFFDNGNNDDNTADDSGIFASSSDDFDLNDSSADFLETVEDGVILNDEILNDSIINDVFEENIIVGEKNSVVDEIYSGENSSIDDNLKDNVDVDNKDVVDAKFNFSEGFILPSLNKKNNNSKTKLASLLSLLGLLSASDAVINNSKKKKEEESDDDFDDEGVLDEKDILSDMSTDYEKPTFYSDNFKN